MSSSPVCVVGEASILAPTTTLIIWRPFAHSVGSVAAQHLTIVVSSNKSDGGDGLLKLRLKHSTISWLALCGRSSFFNLLKAITRHNRGVAAEIRR